MREGGKEERGKGGRGGGGTNEEGRWDREGVRRQAGRE